MSPFQSTLPVGERLFQRVHNPMYRNFNPRSPWGERRYLTQSMPLLILFQSTLPVGGATGRESETSHPDDYFNPRSPWGATYRLTRNDVAGDGISIHAPRGGSDHKGGKARRNFLLFQSTLPVGGATLRLEAQLIHKPYFNPRSPWGERRSASPPRVSIFISIHAPRGGSDERNSPRI